MLSKLKRAVGAVLMTAFGSLIFVASASPMATPPLAVTCKGQWAAIFRPVVENISGNAFGLFLLIAVPAGIIALIGLVFFHWSRHRGLFASFLGIVIFVMIAIQIWPGLADTLLPNGCG